MTNKKNSLQALMRRSLLLSLLLVSTFSYTLAERHERVVDSWQPVHYNVALTLNDQLTEIKSARAEISVLTVKGPIQVLDFDFGAMPVDSVTVGGMPARF